ncbi:MAG: hypothetical protein GY751_14620 [Bacteroidetes bacterium]|nr:hypothetical protein [Bacteroidota bacterium]
MAPVTANLINASALLLFGAWGYLGSPNPSSTALIPVFFGFLLLLCHRGLRSEKRAAGHIALILTALVFLGLLIPLQGSFGRGNSWAVIRVVIMLLTSGLALWSFVRSFRKAENF